MSYPKSLLIIAVLASIQPMLAAQSAPNATPVISLSISPVEKNIKVGSPALIRVVLTNISNHDLAITSDARGLDYTIEVSDEKGNLARDTRLGYAWNGHAPYLDPAKVSPQDLESSAVYGTLKVGATFTRRLDAAKFYQMNVPGKYTIQVQRQDPANPSTLVKSNTITVTVTP